MLQAAIQSCVLTIGSKTGIYNFSNYLAVTRLTRVLSASGQNPIGADKDASVSADVGVVDRARSESVSL